MRRWLVCGGLDGKQEALDLLLDWISQRRPDGVLLAGGLASPQPWPSDPKETLQLQREHIRYWEQCFDRLGCTGVFVALIPGPQDVPLKVFLRAAMDCEIDHPNLHVVHGTLVSKQDVAVEGIGGALTEHEDTFAPQVRVSRTMVEYLLRPLAAAEQPLKVLLLSQPPTGKLGSEDGNPLASELVDSLHPRLCVALGSTAHRGWDRVAHTLVVNPGRLSEGSAAWVDWSQPAQEQVKLLGSVPTVV